MAWSIEALGVALALPNVFPHPERFSDGIMLSDDQNAMFFAIVADYLDAGVEDGCIPPTVIRDVREADGQLEMTIRVSMPVTIDVAAE
ncbi:hypothetical protein J7376_12160 [Paracoccus sp. R12_1]|uniref:hypothetical protein n=1 Tax=unclassified Paracoccus (in: a-proteobacteria) TaxID=2688777 RepID=UPI001ADAD175|nr:MULTISPECIES: hypothetical protein [unclassified Paracoccus (in: a-proteobacteria)]MBO9454647.1 hypothetical protein [Paracoccus sp. R12_2]MBO9487277.1 hypothetical protein [Paracoccus sp. R12_1]